MVAAIPDAGTTFSIDRRSNRVSAGFGLRFRETGIWGPETEPAKWPTQQKRAASETALAHTTPPNRRLSHSSRKSPVARHCVVADAVRFEPVSLQFSKCREIPRKCREAPAHGLDKKQHLQWDAGLPPYSGSRETFHCQQGHPGRGVKNLRIRG